MNKFVCFIMAVLLTACSGGGGGGSSATCINSGRDCTFLTPSDNRGDSSGHNPSGGRGDDTEYTPSDDRGDDTNHEPTNDRNNTDTRAPSSGRNEIISYTSVGRQMGLSFANFGTYTTNADITTNYAPHKETAFFTGDHTREIEYSNIANNVQFIGRAVGTASNENQVVDLAGNATLNFDKDSGISTLGAQFDNWYDIVVKNDNTGSITFTNYKNAYDQVKLDNTPDADGVISSTGAKMDVHYYGYIPESGIPTEAAGLVQWTESPGGAKMDIAFGAK